MHYLYQYKYSRTNILVRYDIIYSIPHFYSCIRVYFNVNCITVGIFNVFMYYTGRSIIGRNMCEISYEVLIIVFVTANPKILE
jgi:hypothetical protein